jgi:hypothetical protein
MEVMAAEVDGLEFGVRHLDAGRVAVWIELAANLETCVGCGGGDQLDDGLVADQRLAAPVSGDERKQAVLHREEHGTTSGANWLISKSAMNGRFAMPWTANDAQTHTHKATTLELKELWAKVANERLEKTGNEGRAVRKTNAVVARQAERS